jgi:hypothetical protein
MCPWFDPWRYHKTHSSEWVFCLKKSSFLAHFETLSCLKKIFLEKYILCKPDLSLINSYQTTSILLIGVKK